MYFPFSLHLTQFYDIYTRNGTFTFCNYVLSKIPTFYVNIRDPIGDFYELST